MTGPRRKAPMKLRNRLAAILIVNHQRPVRHPVQPRSMLVIAYIEDFFHHEANRLPPPGV
jgi:hypothetical protein